MKNEANPQINKSRENSDFEPKFYLALKLLHSKSKDSADKLKAILDETIAQKHPKPLPIIFKKEKKSFGDLSSKVKETEKRPYEKFENFDDASEVKKIRLQTSKLASSLVSSSPESYTALKKTKLTHQTEIKTEKTDDDSESTDIDEENPTQDAADIFDLEALACVVCKSMEITPYNSLLECDECRTVYHQECHKPPVTEETDARSVWCCAKCARSLKKFNSKNTNRSPNTNTESATFATAINSAKETALQLVKAKKAIEQSSSVPTPPIQPFKRLPVEPKVPVSISQQSSSIKSGTNPVGLAALAFNLGAAHSSSSSSFSAASSPSSASVSVKTNSEQKKAQILKKKPNKPDEKKRLNIK